MAREQTFSENPGHNVFEVKGNKDEEEAASISVDGECGAEREGQEHKSTCAGSPFFPPVLWL